MQFVSASPNWQYTIIGSGSGLSPNSRQAIICVNDKFVK